MGTVTVRGLDDDVRHRLKIRAATNNRSMEAELRAILTAAVAGSADPLAPVAGTPPPSSSFPLSAREERVAQLVAQGLTNRQIARVLYLSERTVESHMSSILRKLGCARRSTVASWYTTQATSP